MNKQSDHTTLAVIQNDISYIKDELSDIKNIISEQYVTKVEYEPVKKIVYGLVSVVLTLVFTAIIYLVVQKP